MYDILVYDENIGSFIPYRDERNKPVSFPDWEDAQDFLFSRAKAGDNNQYKIDFRRPRRRRGF